MLFFPIDFQLLFLYDPTAFQEEKWCLNVSVIIPFNLTQCEERSATGQEEEDVEDE